METWRSIGEVLEAMLRRMKEEHKEREDGPRSQ